MQVKLTADDFFRANDREFMDSLDPEKRDAMISVERRTDPENCCECGFYKVVMNRNGSKICGECALDEEIMITDDAKRSFYCPL